MRIDSSSESFFQLIKESKKISIFVSPIVGEEVLAGALGLGILLRGVGKTAEIIFPSDVPNSLASLPGADLVKRDLMSRALHLRFKIGSAELQKVGYYIADDHFNLVLAPEKGVIEAQGLTVSYQPSNIDLLILLGFPSLRGVGKFLKAHALDFASLPIVNIDYHPDNERFGQVNVVDETAKGVSEIIFAHFGSWGLKPSYRAAECLLFGLGLLDSERLSEAEEDLTQAPPGDNYSRLSLP